MGFITEIWEERMEEKEKELSETKRRVDELESQLFNIILRYKLGSDKVCEVMKISEDRYFELLTRCQCLHEYQHYRNTKLLRNDDDETLLTFKQYYVKHSSRILQEEKEKEKKRDENK